MLSDVSAGGLFPLFHTAIPHDSASLTEAMVARKGRASYLGQRSVGHIDPGAASSAMLIGAAATAFGA